ncbi:hypothetical protein C9374_013607 [Naegleria lovaniensis]|uniref:ATPase domain-containing protein n=1 Tax=Naegleria lovaniensis TaxID=51637 RepID=A0AA88GES8_NAELO|nr:uncharacterized protein C9374_013607 [Naegleria lovaniensis]KAG2372706.1 hypothetical protein C9374_013607 [Naegleria lovaniensis]
MIRNLSRSFSLFSRGKNIQYHRCATTAVADNLTPKASLIRYLLQQPQHERRFHTCIRLGVTNGQSDRSSSPLPPNTTTPSTTSINVNTITATNQQEKSTSRKDETEPRLSFLALDATSLKHLLSNQNIGEALKETQQKVSRWTRAFRSLMQNTWIFKLATVLLVLLVLVVEEYMKLSRVQEEFKTNVTDDDMAHFAEAIERKKEEEELLNFAVHSLNQYAMIIGESGSGKSEIVNRLVYKARKQGIPVFYSAATERQYEARLKSELGYFTLINSFFHYVKKLLNVDSSHDILSDLEKVGIEIKKKTGKRPLMVIDNAHRLNTNDEGKQFFRNLQELAKKMADSEALNCIFVITTDGDKSVCTVSEFSSRLRVYEIGEMTREEAKGFLRKKFNVTDPQEMERIFSVTGYIPKYLNQYNQLYQVDLAITEKFIHSGVDPLFNKAFQDVARHILQHGSIDVHDFESLTPSSEVVKECGYNCAVTEFVPNPVRKLLESNVIFRRTGRTVTFKNTAIQNYVKHTLAKLEK